MKIDTCRLENPVEVCGVQIEAVLLLPVMFGSARCAHDDGYEQHAVLEVDARMLICIG